MDIKEYLEKTRNSLPKRRRQAAIRIFIAHVAISMLVLGGIIATSAAQPVAPAGITSLLNFFFAVLFFPCSLLYLLDPFGLFQNTFVLSLILSTTSVLWGYVGSLFLVRR